MKLFFEEGDDVPVLAPIAAIGSAGEDISGLGPKAGHAGFLQKLFTLLYVGRKTRLQEELNVIH